ncbi:unnamed protein product [Somion occarium]|uniref:Uncharacterized protein n=1 Tax=Somion occarium TaxID=3059160 RepID=A0ABP1D1U7_9APHY
MSQDPTEAGSSQAPHLRVEPATSSGVFSTYVSIFHEHLTHTQLHLLGNDHDETALEPSQIQPTFWTSEEKALFFHGLAVHSRLRPDLIAEDIGTKNIVDVCAYLGLLEEGSAELEEQEQEDEDREKRIARRTQIPAAYEMSDRWCALEDKFVSSIVTAEPQLCAETRAVTRELEVALARKSMQSQKDPESIKQFDSWLHDRQEDWKREDWELDAGTLRLVDRALLRSKGKNARVTEELSEDEDEYMDDVQPTTETNTAAATGEPSPEQSAPAPSTTSSTIIGSGSPEAGPSHVPFDDSLIDPVLLAETPPSPPIRTQDKTASPSHKHLAPSEPSTPAISGQVQDGGDGTLGDEEDAEGWETQTARSQASTRARTKKDLSKEERQHLGDLGFQYDDAIEEGLHLFHLGRLAKLMSIYRGLHDVPDDVVSTISFPAMKELAALLKDFTYHLVKLTLASRRRERMFKQGARAWKHSQKPIVSIRNVQHAIALMGVNSSAHRKRLRNLLELYSRQSASEIVGTSPAQSTPLQKTQERETSQDKTIDSRHSEEVLLPPDVDVAYKKYAEVRSAAQWRTQNLSMQRAIRPPTVWLPLSLRPSHTVDFYQYSHPDRPSSPTLPMPWSEHPPHPLSEEDLMSAETDTDDLKEELEDELEVEEYDMDTAETHEADVRERFSVSFQPQPNIIPRKNKRKQGPVDPIPEPSTKETVRTKGRPAPTRRNASRKKYKSREIISDSD